MPALREAPFTETRLCTAYAQFKVFCGTRTGIDISWSIHSLILTHGSSLFLPLSSQSHAWDLFHSFSSHVVTDLSDQQAADMNTWCLYPNGCTVFRLYAALIRGVGRWLHSPGEWKCMMFGQLKYQNSQHSQILGTNIEGLQWSWEWFCQWTSYDTDKYFKAWPSVCMAHSLTFVLVFGWNSLIGKLVWRATFFAFFSNIFHMECQPS